MNKRLLSMFLALCMVVTLLPVSAMAEEIHTPIGTSGEITNFAPLTETEKTVSLGTSIEDLELPETLTATVRTAVPAAENPTQDSGSPETATPTTAAEPEWEETTVDIPVKWESAPEYDPESTGTYVVTPVLEKAYTFAEGVELPIVTVEIITPVIPVALNAAIQGGTPNFTLNESEITVVGFGGHEWVVIGYNGGGVASESGTLTLLLKNGDAGGGYSTTEFHGSSNRYSGSTLQNKMDEAYKSLPDGEKELVVERALEGGSANHGYSGYDDNKVAGEEVSGAHFWSLSVNEANSVDNSVRVFGDYWWLRSPGIDVNFAAVVIDYGYVLADGDYVSSTWAVRPAFKLNLASVVLFTSDASGASAKPTTVGASLSAATPPTGAVKFTMKDDNLKLTVTDTDTITAAPGGTVNIDYTGAVFGTDKYVSAVLADGDTDEVLYYGKLVDLGTDGKNGTATFTVPDDLAAGSYKIKLFNEECNGDYETDFASEPVEIALTVQENTPAPVNGTLVPGANLTGTQVYFGKYDGSPILWYTVAADSDTATLWTTTSMENRQYDPSTHNCWSGSAICGWLNGEFLNAAFAGAEQTAIGQYGTTETGTYETIDISQKIVLPSVEEIGSGTGTGTWGIPYTKSNDGKRSFGDGWWLRSPGIDGIFAAVVDNFGSVYAFGLDVYYPLAVRPAFKLNLPSVLFTSAAEGGKSATVGSLSAATPPTGAVKLTVEDDTQTLEVFGLASGSGSNSLTFTYDAATATTGDNQYISCVVEKDGDVKYYGKLENLSSTASGTVSVPLTNVGNGTYTLKLFAEQANGNRYTDFASEPFEIEIAVGSNGNGTPTDTDKPTVSGVTPNGTDVALTTSTLSIEFGEKMNTAPADIGTVSLDNDASVANGVWQSDKKTIVYDLSSLAYDTQYRVTISGFQDAAGNEMENDSENSFTTTTPTTYTVTYDSNGGSGSMTSGTATEGVAFPLPDNGFTAPEGKRFKTWVIGSASGIQVDAGGTHLFTAAETVYAVWENIPTYTVTVNNSYAEVTGTGSYAENDTVTIHAGTRSNYRFTGWTASDVTFASPGSASTTFTMPANLVTVTASWAPIGSSSSSDDSDSSSVIVTPPAPDKPNSPTQGEIKVSGTVDSKGNVTVNISDKTVTDAFEKALADAKKNGNEQNGITVILRVDTGSKTGSNVTVNLPKTVQDTIIEKKIVNTIVVVDNPDIRIGMDLATVQEINKQAKSDVNITATRGDSSKLTGDAKKAIVSRPVFDLKVNYGNGKAVSSFGAGSVSVTIPYTLGANEKAGNVQAVYVDAKGKVHWLTNSVYDSVEKVLRFSTNHFSTYGIGYKQTNTAFTDITAHWAKEDIEFVVSRGLFSGTSNTTFSPNTAMTRGMFVTALGRLANADVSGYAKSSFTDVKGDAYYMGYIEWASKNNIVNGTGNNKFAPDQSITREQMAVIMSNYAKTIGYTLPKVHVENIFADNAKISTYAKEAVKQMQMAGVISGKNGNLFDPQGTATRAEVSAVLRRFVELAISSDTMQGWTRNDSGQWIYYENSKPVTGKKEIDSTTYTFDQYGVTADAPKNLKYTTYTVQKGDSFWSISRKLGCPMSELERLNNKSRFALIHPGDVLRVPEK